MRREPYSSRALAELLEASGWRLEGGEVRRPAWHAQAACRGVGPEAFFVEDKGPGGTSACGAGRARGAGEPPKGPRRRPGGGLKLGPGEAVAPRVWGSDTPALIATKA